MLHGLERLIALHSVLPIRAGFFDRGDLGIDYSTEEPDWGPVQPVTQALKPLFSVACRPKLTKNNANESGDDAFQTKKADLLPDYFDIAARSVPRDTFRRQTHESPWLETLFVAVAELAFSISKEESSPLTQHSDFVRVLELLFKVALQRKVHLSLQTLLTHAVYTGLLKEQLAGVEWNLTALLIELDVDTFLPNSGLHDSTRLLDALLDRILQHYTHRSPSQRDSNYEVIKFGIVIPLLKGFAAARDLPTFVNLWSAQLSAVEQQRHQNRELDLFSVWEDEDLCNTYSALSEISPTNAQVIEQLQSFVTSMSKEDVQNSEIAAYTQSVILDAGLRRRTLDLTATSTREAMNLFAKALSAVLSSKQDFPGRWRLWRLARYILERYLQPAEEAIGVKGLADVATVRTERLHAGSVDSIASLLEALEAFNFVLVAAQDNVDSGHLFDSTIAGIAAYAKSIAGDRTLSSTESLWNGRVETIDSPLRLLPAYFFTVIRNPTSWKQMRPENRCLLLDQLLILAVTECGQSREELFAEGLFVQAWTSIVSYEYLLNAPCLVRDLVRLLSDRVKSDFSNRKVYVDSIQRIPTRLITRGQRGMLLDLFLAAVLEGENSSGVLVSILSLLATLAEMPKAADAITGHWEPLWKVAKSIHLRGSITDIQITKAFRTLHNAVMDKLLYSHREERRRLFSKLFRKVLSRVSTLSPSSVDRGSLAIFFALITLSWIWVHRNELADSIQERDLSVCRHRMFEFVLGELKRTGDQLDSHAVQTTSEATSLEITLSLLDDFDDVIGNNREVKVCLSKIEERLERSPSLTESLSQKLTRCLAVADWAPEKGVGLPAVQCAETFPLARLYDEEMQLFVRATTERFRSTAEYSLAQVIREVRETGGLTGRNGNNAHSLFVAGLAVASLPSIQEKDSAAGKELSRLSSTVTASLHHSTSIDQFCFAAECLDILLRNHGRCITQWNIDDLLASISVCISQKGPRIDSKFAPTIYTRLCRLMGTLFGIHRPKLGGRFHLVLPVMQRLLYCLFTHANSKKQPGRTDTQSSSPYWLAPLSVSHADHYARLLTSLCEPTVSTVSRPSHAANGHHHERLTDQTKKAKYIAGQYLQYVIMEYARCSLRGSLLPEVKDAILPGLYSALNAMSKDTMRALNAALDVSGRDVFKGLYDDYVKFGKWNNA